jgi:hypothetical protein
MRDSGKFYQLSLSSYDREEISPAAIIKKFPDARKYLVNDSVMVIKPYIEIQGFIEDLSFNDSRVLIKNFQFENHALINLNLYGDLEEEVFNASELKIKYCIFKKGVRFWFSNFVIALEDNTIDMLAVINESIVCPKLIIQNNTIGYLWIWTATPREVLISNNQLGLVEIDRSEARYVWIINNTFKMPDSIGNDWRSYIRGEKAAQLIATQELAMDDLNDYRRHKGDRLLQINSTERSIGDLQITGNSFLDSTKSIPIIFSQLSQKMTVTGNTFETPVIFRPVVANRFVLEHNTFSYVTMEAAMPTTPQNYVSVDWKDLKGKLYWQHDEHSPSYYGKTNEELANSRYFFNLISGYSRLLEVYKSYGNLDDANDVFLDMKGLHLKRYKYLYDTQGGTTNFFQLYLNRLLKVYTRHGTDPAQAMTASLWIIIFFSFIYFFFPSDWDVSSKTKLMADFRTFIEKNEKGYFKPFLRLLKGLVSSFFNAITLSVNSFVTLGFGTIPTRGLAKYICIFQGFLGWFLLSIFIVALINQILI